MQCAVCAQPAEAAYSMQHYSCKHWSHTDCLDEGQVNFAKCVACVEGRATAAMAAGAAACKEPHLTDGRDYVLEPGPVSQNLLSAAVSKLWNRNKPAEKPKPTAREVLRQHVPIEEMFRVHQYGLDHLLKEGAIIDDFLINRYTLSDLQKFEDISQNGRNRSQQTWITGLGLCANHLRTYRDQLPFAELQKLSGFTKGDLFTRLGLSFPPYQPLQCNGDDGWNARDCVALGLTMKDLMAHGLESQEQYKDLFLELGQEDAEAAERDLQVTEEQLQSLKNLEEETKQARLRYLEEQEALRLEQEEEGWEEEDPVGEAELPVEEELEEELPYTQEEIPPRGPATPVASRPTCLKDVRERERRRAPMAASHAGPRYVMAREEPIVHFVAPEAKPAAGPVVPVTPVYVSLREQRSAYRGQKTRY